MKQLLLYISIITLIGCTGTGGQHPSEEKEGAVDTVYTEPAAMSIHRNEPDRALAMIDSAVIVGNITPQRAEYLRAIIQYGGKRDYNLSRQTCLNLLKEYEKLHKTQKLSNEDSTTILHTYTLLVSIEYTSSNNVALVRYATEASRLAHILDSPSDIGKMESSIARVMAEAGKTDESLDRMHKICEELRQMDSFKGVVSYHSTSKEMLHTLLDNDRFVEMVPVCLSMLERIDELDKHPERFSDIAEGFDTSEFIDMARGQTYAFLAVAYARQYSAAKTPPRELTPAVRAQLLQKARAAEAAVNQTQWCHSIDCDKMMTAAYHHMEEFDKFDTAMDRIDSTKTDTITNNHLISLYQRSVAAKMRGQTERAYWYMERATNLRDSIDQRDQRNQLNELATVYHLQEEQLARQQKEAEAELSHIINIVLAIGLVAVALVLVWFFRQKHIVERKNRALAREIAENADYREKYERLTLHPISSATESEADAVPAAPTSQLPDDVLYQQLSDIILREQLYLDPMLDRQALVDRFSLPKERIGAAFAKGSPYKSLIDFLTDCRIHYATKLLAERSDMSIAEIAQASGFPSADTFGRNFRQKYALTPSQYRKQQG